MGLSESAAEEGEIVRPAGVEHPSKTAEISQVVNEGGAKSGALPANPTRLNANHPIPCDHIRSHPPSPPDGDLQRIITLWPTLSAATKAAIATLCDACAPRRNSDPSASIAEDKP